MSWLNPCSKPVQSELAAQLVSHVCYDAAGTESAGTWLRKALLFFSLAALWVRRLIFKMIFYVTKQF